MADRREDSLCCLVFTEKSLATSLLYETLGDLVYICSAESWLHRERDADGGGETGLLRDDRHAFVLAGNNSNDGALGGRGRNSADM